MLHSESVLSVECASLFILAATLDDTAVSHLFYCLISPLFDVYCYCQYAVLAKKQTKKTQWFCTFKFISDTHVLLNSATIHEYWEQPDCKYIGCTLLTVTSACSLTFSYNVQIVMQVLHTLITVWHLTFSFVAGREGIKTAFILLAFEITVLVSCIVGGLNTAFKTWHVTCHSNHMMSAHSHLFLHSVHVIKSNSFQLHICWVE